MTRLLCLLILLTFPFTALAELPAGLTEDFSPLGGYIVMPMDDQEFLIDLDATGGVHTGDIFSIVHPGKPIVHPVSGKVIGNLDESAAFLKVTRIKSGYSYVRKIGGDAKVAKGDKIQRFEAVPAIVRDDKGSLQEFESSLQKALPQLDWLAEGSDTKPLLVFDRSANALLVKANDGTTLFSYPMPVLNTQAASTSPKPVAPAPTMATTTAPAPAAEGIIRNQQERSSVWHGQKHNDEAVGLSIDDFDNDGLQETAFLVKGTLVISRYQGSQNTKIAEQAISSRLTPLAIDSFDLNGNGRPEIFLSAVAGGTPTSSVFELDGQALTEIAHDLPMLFRRIDRPQGGALILGQKRHDMKLPLSGHPFQVSFSAGSYDQGPDYPLPLPAHLYGFAPFVTPQGEPDFVFLNTSDYLTVMGTDGERKFESPDRYGGSENRFDLATDSSNDIPQVYFLPQRVIVANGEILVPQNEGQRMTQRWRQYNKSRLVSLSWNGLSLDENWRTSDQNGQTADFAVADVDNDGQQELVLAVKFARKGFLSKAKSALVVYETH